MGTEEVMIGTPIGLIKWSVIRKALVRLAHEQARQEHLNLEALRKKQKRMETMAKKKAEKELQNGTS